MRRARQGRGEEEEEEVRGGDCIHVLAACRKAPSPGTRTTKLTESVPQFLFLDDHHFILSKESTEES